MNGYYNIETCELVGSMSEQIRGLVIKRLLVNGPNNIVN